MRRLIAALLFSAALAFSQEDGGPPPEPSPETPACDNHFKSAHKCACGKAMKCHGKIDDAPDAAIGSKWCTQYCRKDKCLCIGPCETMHRTALKNAGVPSQVGGIVVAALAILLAMAGILRKKDDHSS